MMAAAAFALTTACAQMLPDDHAHEGEDHDHAHEDEDHDHEDHDHAHEDEDHDHGHADEDHDHAHEDHDHGHADEDHDHAHEDEDHGDAVHFDLQQQRLTGLQVATASVQSLRPSLAAVGRLHAAPGADAVVTAPVGGRVVAVGGAMPTVGQAVDAGSVVLAVVPSPVDSADSASIDLAVEQAAIEQAAARREVERLTPLVAEGFVPERRLTEAQQALRSSDASLRSARRRQASYAQAQAVGGRQDAIEVPSPQAGVVASVAVAAGSWVTAGEGLLEVSDPSRLVLEVEVPVAYASRVQAVSGAWFRIGRDGALVELASSALESIGTRVDPRTQTFPVRFRVEAPAVPLFSGAVVQAHLALDQPVTQVAVPSRAIVEDAGVAVVFVQVDEETFLRRPVRLGIRSGDDVGVVEGIASGDRVVTSGAYALKLASAQLDTIGHGHAH
jgi:RND family efflux transporter MFP subunit